MWVDPPILRKLASQSQETAKAIGRARLPTLTLHSADCLDGSSTQTATRLVAEAMDSHVVEMSKQLEAMGVSVRGASEKYEVTDRNLAADLNALWK